MNKRFNALWRDFWVYRKDGMAKDTMLSFAQVEVNASNTVGFGADAYIKYLNATVSNYDKANENATAFNFD